MVLEKLDVHMNVDSYLLLCTNINRKWIKDLDVKPETLKLLEDIGGTLSDVCAGDFLNGTPFIQELK